MVAPFLTSFWSIFFLSISLPPILGLPTLGSVPIDRPVVKSEDITAELEESLFQKRALANGSWRQEETSLASQLGDLLKVKETFPQACTVDTCVSDHSTYLVPNVDPPCICNDDTDIAYNVPKQTSEDIGAIQQPAKSENKQRREKRDDPRMKDLNFTYVPPPQTDITPDLLAESLAVQPQNTATIGSIIPNFPTGVISYGVQLNGLVAATMTLNASTSLPCDSIGTNPEPNLVLIPADVNNATAKPVVSDCEIIAVNMYDPNVVQYWIQRHDGSIFSLAGSNKVQNIGATNTTAGVALVLRAQLPIQSKRSDEHVCTPNCTHMITKRALAHRAISPADVHTSSFSEEACAAINCNNNGGKPSLFNPFTRTCGCADPVLVEIDHSGI